MPSVLVLKLVQRGSTVMGFYTLMQKRGTGYYFRQAIPQELHKAAGKKEFVKSLGTHVQTEALLRHKAISLEFARYIESLKRGLAVELPTIESVVLGNQSDSEAASDLTVRIVSQSNATDLGKGKNLNWLVEEWIKQKASDVGDFKQAGLASRVSKWFQEFHNKSLFIGELEATHLMAFRKHLQNTQLEKANKTKNTYLDQLKSLTSFAHAELLIKHNPFYGLRTSFDEDDSDDRLSYDKSDLEKIFLNSEFVTFREKPERYWIPLIGLFTGCRIREIAQLHVTDIRNYEGIWYFDINKKTSDKRLKTASSKRRIPIHKELLKCGLLDYLHSLEKGTKYLFPNLRFYRGNPAVYIGKWYSYYKLGLGIPRGKDFHSYRHTIKDLLREAEVPKSISDSLTGHTSGDMGDDYGSDGYSLKQLNKALQNVIPPISLADYYIDTAYPLNPFTEQPKQLSQPHLLPDILTLAETRPPLTERSATFITLAEVYHRIGKALYGDSWKDYEIVDCHEELVKLDLNTFVREEHNFTAQSELRLIKETDLSLLRPFFLKVDNEDRERHQRIMGLLFKEMKCAGIECISKPTHGLAQCPSTEFWGSADFKLSTIFSNLRRNSDGATWELLFSPKGLQQSLKYFKRAMGAKKNPKGGRRVSIPWELIDNWLIELFNVAEPPTSKHCQQVIEQRLKENMEGLLQSGESTYDKIPSESAIKKRVNKLRAEGKILRH